MGVCGRSCRSRRQLSTSQLLNSHTRNRSLRAPAQKNGLLPGREHTVEGVPDEPAAEKFAHSTFTMTSLTFTSRADFLSGGCPPGVISTCWSMSTWGRIHLCSKYTSMNGYANFPQGQERDTHLTLNPLPIHLIDRPDGWTTGGRFCFCRRMKSCNFSHRICGSDRIFFFIFHSCPRRQLKR